MDTQTSAKLQDNHAADEIGGKGKGNGKGKVVVVGIGDLRQNEIEGDTIETENESENESHSLLPSRKREKRNVIDNNDNSGGVAHPQGVDGDNLGSTRNVNDSETQTDIETQTRTLEYSRWQMWANRLIHSTAYAIFYLSMIVLSLVLLIVTLVAPSTHNAPWFGIIELLLIIAMGAEIGIRIAAADTVKLYFKSKLNLFDFSALLLVLLSFVVVYPMVFLISGPDAADEEEEISTSIILLLRYGVQLLRLVVMVRQHGHRANKTINTPIVDLERYDQLGDTDGDGDGGGRIDSETYAAEAQAGLMR